MTVREVAESAGVSPASVSNYFHKPHKLSEATRDRIRRAVDELGFLPNDAARTLRTGASPVVGYIAFELAGATTPEIASAIEKRISARDMYLLMANDTGSQERERSYLRLFAQQQVSGVIIAPVGDVEAELAQMRSQGIASVLSARRAESPEQASVSIDHVGGGRLAMEHLLGLGRRRVGFVASSLDLRQVTDRLNGALSAVGAVPGASLEVVPVPERSVEAGIACAQEIARRPPDQRPDALFCVNDLLAIGVLQAFAAGGRVRVPEDIAVIGYDDIEFARSTIVPLSTVRTPHTRFGTALADLLFEEISRLGDDAAQGAEARRGRRIEFAPELVARRSTLGH
ncbi:LacI family DNA-binding transcriptional regulator [Nocardiopsis sp. RSe5-2]|uniref:LacI family DNA-binding transcriptional regulator n=1 Tax=Nocardiopsis endophytica TaxID=3018445 RepID=A0ABT4TZ39_9ACTN|nr:LacI family DNA-binding transcriptional regulator [Nocardiopsis endophytica]MDA2809965.1 LacI family DNA-binding transcriptional regulator [Nocardiopsis endophytica]